MPKEKIQNSSYDLTREQIQSLIATSTGFIEAYIIPVHKGTTILLPQTMILSAMNVTANSSEVEWHDKFLPTFIVHSPHLQEVTALVIEGDEEATRFAILCDTMPKSLRLRISEVQDIDKKTPTLVYQYVRVNDEEFQVPHLTNIQRKLFHIKK